MQKNIENMDDKLRELLEFQMEEATEEQGIVAACIVDGEKEVFSHSVWEDGEVTHAERNAAIEFVDKYGQPSEDAYIVTTLSPCSRYDELNKFRNGKSCADLLAGNDELLDEGIKRVHVGYMDPWQADKEELEDMGLDLTITDDEKLNTSCENLFQYFRKDEEEMAETNVRGFVLGSIEL